MEPLTATLAFLFEFALVVAFGVSIISAPAKKVRR